MAGFFTYNKLKHNDITFYIGNTELYFNDYRHFGTISFCLDINCLNAKLNSLGIDIFSKEFTYNKLNHIIKKSKQNNIIAVFLMNQKKISGIGNYLRSEILYDALINPFIELKDLTDSNIKKLFNSILKISKLSYKSQKKGFVNEKKYTENYTFQIYQQKKTFKNENVLSKMINGRTIFYIKEQL